MTNIELINLAKIISQNKKEIDALKGAKFAYAMLKNFKKIEDEIKIFKEVEEGTAEFKEFNTKRTDLIQKYAKKNETGEFVQLVSPQGDVTYDIDESNPDLQKDFKDLTDEYASVIEEHNNSMRQLMTGEISIEFHKIQPSDLPTDISLQIMQIIEPFVTA